VREKLDSAELNRVEHRLRRRGGTLTHALAPTGKRILLLERGGYLPREAENWNPGRGLAGGPV
jgi:hypothetical protein